EGFDDATLSANDCFRPVSRWFDRIQRPEQILDALPRAMAVLRDPAACGPVTLAFCQDVQAEAFDYPLAFFAPLAWPLRRQPADAGELEELQRAPQQSRGPLLGVGGGVRYSPAEQALAELYEATGLSLAETHAGKGALLWNQP